MATLPTNRTSSNTVSEHVNDHNELHDGHNLNEAHRNATTDAHDASAISFSPTGTIASTDVQSAIAEVASEATGGGTKTIRIPHTWALNGTGAVDTLPGLYISLPSGQTASLVAVRHATTSGTATVSVRRNGTGATGFTGLSVTSTATTTDPANVALADNDYLDLDISAASSPVDLRVTAWVEYTV
jgi:hypothetical protein